VLHRPVELAQYVSVALTAELLEHGLAGSIGTVGDALDNALCESTIGLFKTEAIHCRWTRNHPQWRSSDLPGGGHENSPVTVTVSPRLDRVAAVG
jgi:transposase InsO family protein